jgi:sugar transferase (PEP-CTERM/EpsH1 system associated)
LLKYLSQRASVYLGTFIDDPEDWKYLDDLRALCAEVFALSINRRYATFKSGLGLLNGEALSVRFYRSAGMQRWVDNTIKMQGIDKVVVFSSTMAQFVRKEKYPHMFRAVDFVDVDSDKWRQYAESTSWPMSWVYRRESRELFSFEKIIAKESSAAFFVSREEAELFKTQAPELSSRIDYFCNGVDLEYFNPDCALSNPYRMSEMPIVFTGAMDYFANIDAVTWFVKKIMPGVISTHSNACFYIVGSNPPPDVRALDNGLSVRVTGRVPDVRGYLRHAHLAVAPMRIARGIQNKVLEALAMGKPVIASPAAMEGIGVTNGTWLSVVDEPADWISAIKYQLNDVDRSNSTEGRNWVRRHFDWNTNLDRLGEYIFLAA